MTTKTKWQSKVKCSQCGKERFTNPKALEARLKKFGSIEEIEKNWVCRECTNENNEVANDKLSDEVGENAAANIKEDDKKIDSKIYGPADVQ